MLVRPTKGFARSTQAHNVRLDVLCDWIDSITRNSSGNLSIFIKTGVFSKTPLCVGSARTAQSIGDISIDPQSPSELLILTYNNSFSGTVDGNFTISCKGAR